MCVCVYNTAKTEMINVNCQDRLCFVEGNAIKRVENFKYLGTTVSANGSLNEEFKDRIRKADQAVGRLGTFLRSGSLSVHSKLKLYETMVKPILIYGHESWYSTVTSDAKFLSFENKVLRRILNIRWEDRVRNTRIREITKVRPVDECVRLSRWRWLGHSFRREGSLVQDGIGWTAEDRRGRGRQRETGFVR